MKCQKNCRKNLLKKYMRTVISTEDSDLERQLVLFGEQNEHKKLEIKKPDEKIAKKE